MAPRRRGANKAKDIGNFSLGDLVLAKVKGFPAWPAVISRPEDWEKVPDPKKYFVQFFGTKEIAFVAPVDIQAFTNETKNKLSARCHGKTKYFTQAVNEICAAFDELEKQKASGLRDDTDDSHIGSEVPSVDGVRGHVMDATEAVVLNAEKANTILGDAGSDLEHATQRCGESVSHDETLSVSCRPIDSSSPVLSPVIESESSIGAEINKHARTSGLKDPSCLKVEVSDCKDACNVNDLGHADNVQSTLTDGDKRRKLGTGSRRSEVSDDRKRSGGSNRMFLKYENSEGYADLSSSRQILKGGQKGKNAVSVRSDSPGALKSVSDVNSGNKDSGNKDKNLLKVQTSLKVKNELQILVDSERADEKNSSKKNKTQVPGKRILRTNETSHATKKLKSMDTKDDKTLKPPPEGVKRNLGKKETLHATKKKLKSLDTKDDKTLKSPPEVELKRSTSCLKTGNSFPSRGQTRLVGSDDSVREVLAGTKHVQVQKAMPDSGSLASDENTEKSSRRLNGDATNLTVKQVQKKRKAVCLFDNDEETRTPVHGGASQHIKSPSTITEVMKCNDAYPENANVAQLANRISCALEDGHLKEKADEVRPVHLPHSPEKLDSKQLPSEVAKLISIPPVKSPMSVPMKKSNTAPLKSSKPLLKVSSNATQKKTDHGSSKSLNSMTAHKKKHASSVESSKTTPKTLPQVVEVPASTEDFKELGAFHGDRLKVGMEQKSSLYVGSRTPETAKTMKHLIAVAQAKRRLVAQSHSLPLGLHDVQGGTPSPPKVKPSLSVSSDFAQADLPGVNKQLTLASPSTNEHHFASQNQLDSEENEGRRVGSVQKAVGGSLSGGTDAAVAREAFEGMIETLSRTKESIGRTTRLAIDCAKYGIANEVVELLIRMLENETSIHRKVDLFFLVDSITQCSHNQKGIAGASYIPAVQGALPRLLRYAAPPGAIARENRRQCLKVLRLWLERKIFPESVLRRYMDDIGVSNDDMAVSFSSRRPFRVERSMDDPIREMEGMLVDEYGSNATIQLPGLLSSNVFEEDEDDDFPSNASPADTTRTLVESETSTVTPNDKRHRILEDVDGELEMEDVSGHPKDERPILLNSSSEMNVQLQGLDRILDAAPKIYKEIPDILEDSPPPPLDSPPSLPPLPSSPPPPISPSQSPPPLPPVFQPPPLPPSGPPPSLVPQSSGLAQPSLLSQALMPPQSSHQPLLELEYQQSVPRDCNGMTSGYQIVQIAGSSFHGGHNNAVVKNEVLSQAQPSACFPPMAGCSSQEPSGFIPQRQLQHGQNNHTNSQVPQLYQQFHLGNPSVAPRHMHPIPAPPQNPPNQYSYSKPTVQQNRLHSFHSSFSLPSFPGGPRQFDANEPWRMPSSELKTNNHHGLWRGRIPSCPVPPFGQEGSFQPSLERPPMSNVGFQHVNPNNLPAPPPMSGHGVPQMLPCRPDIPALNCWRPT